MSGQGAHSKGSATSAAKMNQRVGVHVKGQKFLVEDGKWVSAEQLKRDAERGLAYFNSRRRTKII